MRVDIVLLLPGERFIQAQLPPELQRRAVRAPAAVEQGQRGEALRAVEEGRHVYGVQEGGGVDEAIQGSHVAQLCAELHKAGVNGHREAE